MGDAQADKRREDKTPPLINNASVTALVRIKAPRIKRQVIWNGSGLGRCGESKLASFKGFLA